jgi:hypothetical protein
MGQSIIGSMTEASVFSDHGNRYPSGVDDAACSVYGTSQAMATFIADDVLPVQRHEAIFFVRSLGRPTPRPPASSRSSDGADA